VRNAGTTNTRTSSGEPPTSYHNLPQSSHQYDTSVRSGELQRSSSTLEKLAREKLPAAIMSTVPAIVNFWRLNLLQQDLQSPPLPNPHGPLQYYMRTNVPSWLGSFIGLNSPLLLYRPPSRGSETLDLCKHIFRQCKGQARRFGMITVGSSKRRTSGAPSVRTKKFPGIIPSSESTEIYLRRINARGSPPVDEGIDARFSREHQIPTQSRHFPDFTELPILIQIS
jgi:hypothetical protein